MIKKGMVLTMLVALSTIANASFAPLTSPIPRLRPEIIFQSNKPNNSEINTLVQIAEHERQKISFEKKFPQKSNNLSIGLHPIRVSIIPRLRSNNTNIKSIAKKQTVRTINSPTKTTRKGSICGIASIKGTATARIQGSGRCGIANPVKVTQVAGINLTRELIVNCSTAKRLNTWVNRSAKPIIGRQGGGLQSIQIIGGYSCRTRNSKKGAKLSEHAKGNAVDIAGFKLRDGTVYSVEKNWRRGNGSRTLKKLHKSACGPFGTVLGPNSDRHHKDHFHFDIAKHRGGSYCR